jgi:hypothetical protein
MVATDALPVRPYVTRLTRESLDERDGHRAMKIAAFSINLEQTGDIIIDKNFMELAQKKIKRKLARGAMETTVGRLGPFRRRSPSGVREDDCHGDHAVQIEPCK